MTIIDISVPISSRTVTYPGDPPVKIETWAALANGDVANVTFLHFGAHTGTHVDAPAHFIERAPTVDSLDLNVLVGTARVIEIPEDVQVIERETLSRLNLDQVSRVLFKTRNSSFWADRPDRFREDFTYISPDAAELLVQNGIRLVGIDYLSVEKFKPVEYETHNVLLSAGCVIIEGLNLSLAKAGDYELICLPLKICEGKGDGAPARAILRTI